MYNNDRSTPFWLEIKNLLSLSLPIIISQVGYVLMGFSDNVMVGKLGAASLGAAGVSNSLFFLATVIGIGGLSVLAPMVSKAKEEGQLTHCGTHLKAGLGAAAVYSLLILAALYTAVFFFDAFGQTPEVTVLAQSYLAVLALSVPPMMFFIAIKQFADGLSNTRIGMYVSLGGLALNVALCFVFIFGWGTIPAFGLNGAALATTLTRMAMLGVLWVLVKRNKRFQEELKGFRIPFRQAIEDCKQLLQKGFPTGFQMLAECSAFSLAAVMAGWFGAAHAAAHQIVISWAGLSYMISSGLSVAVSIRVGAGLGAKSRDRILLAAYMGLALVIVYELAMFLGFLAGKNYLASLFTFDADVMAIAPSLMVLMGLFQVPDGVQIIWLGVLRGLLDVEIPTYLVTLAYLGVCLPTAYVLGVTFGTQTSGIWLGLLIGLCLSAVLLTLRFLWYRRKLRFE